MGREEPAAFTAAYTGYSNSALAVWAEEGSPVP